MKVDYYMDGLLIPVIGYEVFHPINKSQLDLNYCKDYFIKLNIPVTINEDKLYEHDPNSDYYNDECSAYTTDEGTDILLYDRQNEYIENNYSLCENKCTFTEYEKNEKKALCECITKPKIMYISEIVKDENILSNDFNTSSSTSNIATMKCVDTLFSIDGLLTNIGSNLILFILIFYAVSAIIYYKCGYQMIQDHIEEITNEKNPDKGKLSIYLNNPRSSMHKISSRMVNKIAPNNKESCRNVNKIVYNNRKSYINKIVLNNRKSCINKIVLNKRKSRNVNKSLYSNRKSCGTIDKIDNIKIMKKKKRNSKISNP